MATKRLDYIDTLKFLAIFGIIAIHSFSLFPHSEILHHNIGTLRQLFRWAVPVFLMISGALLLNRDIDLKVYFKKRFVRVFYPLLFFLILAQLVNGNVHFLSAYWYAWMILGAYLAIPIVNKFVQNSNETELFYYVLIFCLCSIFWQAMNTLGISYALDINFFITPVSYLIVGYYLSVKKFKYSANKMIVISLIVFIVSTFLKLKFGNFMEVYGSGVFSTRLDLGFIQIVQSSSVFLLIKQLYESGVTSIFLIIRNFLQRPTCKKFILSVSKASYGMFLVHRRFFIDQLGPFVENLHLTGTQVCISIAGVAVSAFLLSWIAILIMSRIPVLKIFSGYA